MIQTTRPSFLRTPSPAALMSWGFAAVATVLGVAAVSATGALVTVAAEASAAAHDLQSLAGYRDKNRVWLVFAPSLTDTRFVAQQKLLAADSPAAKERDLVPITVTGADHPALRQRFDVKAGQFRVVLVGKDGHTAFSSEAPVTAAALWARIDAMPMRKDEMRAKAQTTAKGK